MSAWYNKTMAFPGTLNINYYKGDTYEFNIYPKKSTDGSAFDLTSFMGPDLDSATTGTQTAIFKFSTSRGTAGLADQHQCYATISDNGSYVKCAIRPADGAVMTAGTDYVYDVQIQKSATPYPLVYTLLTGIITVTDEVTSNTP